MATGIKYSEKPDFPTCTSCVKSKMSRLPFNQRGARASQALELVHSDLCDPMENASIEGSKYFLTLIDDHTRKTFIYFLKSKDQVVSCFEEFQAQVENEIDRKIKRLRTMAENTLTKI